MSTSSVTGFYNFLNMYETKRTNIRNGCLAEAGQKSAEETGTEYRKKLDALKQETYSILPDNWRILADKKNKTPEEIQQLDKDYKQGFLNFGNDYKNYLDKKFGNGDGVLTKDEFIKSEMDDLNVADKGIQKSVQNFAQKVDLDSDNQIDGKEMAALMSMYDMDVTNGNIDGKLKYYDIESCNLSLIESQSNKYGKGIKERLQMMYEFLFPSEK